MKTTKVILIAALMAFATLGMSQTKTTPPTLGQSPTISASIPFQAAIHNRAIVLAMHTQLTPDFLKVERPIYSVRVYVNHISYCVCGTYGEWKRFFGTLPYDPNLGQ